MILNRNKPSLQDRRIVFRFLFLPRTLHGETRWLEFVFIQQMYSTYYGYFERFYGSRKWKNECFVKMEDIEIE